MAERKVENVTATGALTRVLRAGLASAFSSRGLAIFLVGAAVMAAVGAWVGTQVRLDELEIRTVGGPRLRVSPSQGGKASVTIP